VARTVGTECRSVEVVVPLQVELVSADRRVWSGQASMVVARTVEGEMGVLPGHAPVLAVLAPGEIRITPSQGGPIVANAEGGFLSVEHDRVTVVSDSAALVSGSTAL
jgi:F-type H+-transporting ATPase subunit epsilon